MSEIAGLAAEIAALSDVPSRRRYDAALKMRIGLAAQSAVAGGRTQGAVARELGVSGSLLSQCLKASSMSRSSNFHAVSTTTSIGLTVRAANGVEISGLSVNELAALLRALG